MKEYFYFDIKYMFNELKRLINPSGLTNDLIAGVTVAYVAIPLSLAIAMISGVRPELGLISAIIGGIVAALFGGTRMAITGPSVAMAILVSDIVANKGIEALLIIGILCGIFQIVSGLCKLGRLSKLVPLAVISAYTAGIAFIIIIGQIPKILQIPKPIEHSPLYLISHINLYFHDIHWVSLVLAILTVIILKIMIKLTPKAPNALFAVAIPTILVLLFHVDTLDLVGTIPDNLLSFKLPNFGHIDNWGDIFKDAIEVFLLASLETLLSSSAVDIMGAGDKHNANQELLGQGMANIVSASFGGIPVTSAIARSSVNIAVGAKTRRAAIIHSIAIFLIAYFLPITIEVVPVATLSGILIAYAISMFNFKELVKFWKNDKTEVLIYMFTFFSIILTNLISGIEAGILTAFVIIAVRMLSTRASIKLWTNKEVLRVSFSGSLAFWSYEKLDKIKNLVISKENLKFVIFDLNEVNMIDSTAISHILDISTVIKSHNINIIFHGLTNEQRRLLNLLQLNNNHNLSLHTTETINNSNSKDDSMVNNSHQGDNQTHSQTLYYETITENDVKTILEQQGVKHSAIDHLKHGMEKFLDQYVLENNQLFQQLSQTQNPHTLFITCSDSRINPNFFLSAGLGELFIVRNVGNVIPRFNYDDYNHSEGAAIEFALKNLNIRNIILCAHTECGAVTAAFNIHNAELNKSKSDETASQLINWINRIKSGFVTQAPQDVYHGIKLNLLNQIDNLKTYPVVQELLQHQQLHIAAWLYDVKTAHILEYDYNLNKFECMVQHDK